MKKIISLCTIILIISSLTLMAFADINDEAVYIINGTKMELIYGSPYNHKTDHEHSYGLKAVYEVVDEKPVDNSLLRSYPCDYCSTGKILTSTIVEEWGPKMVSCPQGGYGSDSLVEYKYYSVEKCNNCNRQYSKTYSRSVWKIGCDNTGLWDTQWYTIGQGTNIHCTIDPKTWR